MRNLLLDYNGVPDGIPQQVLRTTLTKQFDTQWPSGLLTSVVSETVPYFPLDRNALKAILQTQLREMTLRELERGNLADLVYDSDLLDYLTSHKHIHYLKYSTPNGNNSIIVAEKGGRSIARKGPLLTLQALIVRYMQPWRGDRILHIGVEPSVTKEGEGNEARLRVLGAGAADSKQRPFLYLQWCRVTPRAHAEGFSHSFGGGRSTNSFGGSDSPWEGDASSCDSSDADDGEERCSQSSSSSSSGSSSSDSSSDSSSSGYNAVALEGSVNTRVGMLYHLSEGEVLSPYACQTKWIGHLESSQKY
jgi:hypothetical protein